MKFTPAGFYNVPGVILHAPPSGSQCVRRMPLIVNDLSLNCSLLDFHYSTEILGHYDRLRTGRMSGD